MRFASKPPAADCHDDSGGTSAIPRGRWLSFAVARRELASDGSIDLFRSIRFQTLQELIHIQQLPREFATELNAFVREQYLELWRAVQERPPE